MKIAIDCREILNPQAGIVSGIPEYIDGLVRSLGRVVARHRPNELILFFRSDYPREKVKEFLEINPSFQIKYLPYKRGNFFINHFWSAWKIATTHPDILLSPTGQAPLGWLGHLVVVVHDLAIYDHPEWFPGGLSRWISTKIIVPQSLCRAEKIIAVSEATKKDLIRHFKIQPEKIYVVYPAVTVLAMDKITAEEIHQKFNLPEKYFLCLGTIEPRKNFILAVQAMEIFHKKFPDIKLIIAGKRGWKYQETVDEIARVNVGGETVKETGYITAEEKNNLLANAQAVIFPSFYEGFGLPVLEAMKAGIPVIATRNGSLPEVGGSATHYVSDDDFTELAVTMSEIMNNEIREKLIAVGKEQAKKFDWGKTAEAMMKILTEK